MFRVATVAEAAPKKAVKVKENHPVPIVLTPKLGIIRYNVFQEPKF